MGNLFYKRSCYVLYALFVVILIVVICFFCGGEAEGMDVIAGVSPHLQQPARVDALLFLLYGVSALAVAVTLVSAMVRFVSLLKENPKGCILWTSIGMGALIALLITTWLLGSGTSISITGYEGSGNVYFWLKLADMFLYSIYVLLAIAVVAILFSCIRKKIV